MPLPDYLEPQDEATIEARMLDRISDDLDKTEGSFLWDATMPAALELALADDRLRTVFELGFVRTTFGEFLDSKAEEYGLSRRPAISATGIVRFEGTNGTLVPAGSTVSTPGDEAVMPQEFTTDADVTIAGGFGSVAATASTGGEAGNVAVGAIQIVDPPIPGITGVTNLAAFEDGVDAEDDESLRTRIFTHVRNPGTSGNPADYVNWASSVPGVGGVSVVPLEDGAGTVTVALIGTDKLPASAGIVDDVTDYIATLAPIGAVVTVEAATTVTITITADITVAAGYVENDVRAAAAASILAYLKSTAFTEDNDVRHARVITAILDTPGVTDVTGLTLNGGTANVAIGAKEVPTIGTVTWS